MMAMKKDTKRRLALLLSLAALAAISCRPRQAADSVLLGEAIAHDRASEPVQDILVWTFDPRREPSTHWLRGNRAGGGILASREGLVLTAGEGVWDLSWRDVDVPLCDCDRWNEADLEGNCPPSEDVAIASIPVLTDLVSGEEILPIEAPDTEPEDGPVDVELQYHVDLLTSVGPFLFFRYGQHGLGCGAAHDTWAEEFLVFDLAAGEPTDLLTDAEREAVNEGERAEAYEQIRADNLVAVEGPDDLDLTVIEPVMVPGMGLAFRYQFTASSSFADSDGNWGAYSRSVVVPASEVPAALQPYMLLPPALASFNLIDEELTIGGWMTVTADEAQLTALARAFTMEEPTGN